MTSSFPSDSSPPSLRVPDRFLALDGVRAWPTTVIDSADLSPVMRRITLTGPDLDQLDHEAGQDLMVPFAIDGGRVITRRYTIRSLDRANRQVSLDIALHGDGPGVRWARSVRPGETVELAGPRGKIFLNPAATVHLFFGDESAIPMALAMMEALPDTTPARAFLEVNNADDAVPWQGLDEHQLVWVHRAGAPADEGSRLMSAFVTNPTPVEGAQVYVAGEVMLVRALQQKLITHGFQREQLSPKAYWGRGSANALNGEPEQRAN